MFTLVITFPGDWHTGERGKINHEAYWWQQQGVVTWVAEFVANFKV